jgi:ubiquinone/menaquinone biosynthesis C-methylase UbiE
MARNNFSGLATRAAYGASQLPRLAWYAAHAFAMRRLSASQAHSAESKRPRAHTDAPVPDQRRLWADMAALLRRDLANVENGIYPLPSDHDGSLLALINRSKLFFEDLPAIHRRRENGGHSEVLTEDMRKKRPPYFLQNFHYQTGGWLTEDSAKRYDTQVEVLFNGTANATRRQALPELHEIFAGRDQRRLRLLDVGCGTGRFLDCVKQVWPRLPCIGLDLSEAYLREARRHLKRWSRVSLVVGNGESMPLPDASYDAVTSIFTFHELPPKVRRIVIKEFARVLKPGGRLILIDSLQRADDPAYEGLLELFPQSFHEPYYGSYLEEDFAAIASSHGLMPVRETKAFVSKVLVFDKPLRESGDATSDSVSTIETGTGERRP